MEKVGRQVETVGNICAVGITAAIGLGVLYLTKKLPATSSGAEVEVKRDEDDDEDYIEDSS